MSSSHERRNELEHAIDFRCHRDYADIGRTSLDDIGISRSADGTLSLDKAKLTSQLKAA